MQLPVVRGHRRWSGGSPPQGAAAGSMAASRSSAEVPRAARNLSRDVARRHARHGRRRRRGARFGVLGGGQGQVPDAGQESMDALDAGGGPRTALVPRTDEQQNRRTVSAPYWATSSSGLATLPRLLLIRWWSAPRIWPWLRRARNGSSNARWPMSRSALMKKRVQKVQHGVLRAAGVQVHRHPVPHRLGVPGRPIVVRRGVAEEVPARVDEGVHGVGLRRARLAAHRAGGRQEFRVRLERRDPGRREVHVPRQQDGQLRLGTGCGPWTSQRRSGWGAPVALRLTSQSRILGDGRPAQPALGDAR